MDIGAFRTALKNGTLSGVYILCGEENYLKRYYLGEMRHALLPDAAFDAFNHAVGEGEKPDYGFLLDAAESPPMMAEKKLIEWHLCDFAAMKEGDLSAFSEFCARVKDFPEAVCVFPAEADRLDVGTLPRRPSKLYTALSACASVLVFEKSTDAALTQWIRRHFAHDGITADDDVPAALLARAGHSMDALAGEIEKLTYAALSAGRTTVSAADVAAVTSATSESDAFGLTNAILDGRADAAYACLADMKRRKVEPTLILSTVARTYADLLAVAALAEEGVPAADIAARLKIHSYKATLYLRAAKKRPLARLERALFLCREADAAVKGSGGADGYLALDYLLARTLA